MKITVFLLLIGQLCYAQQIDFCEVYRYTRNTADFRYIDSLLQSKDLSNRDIAELYTIRAKVARKLNHELQSVQEDIDKAVTLMGDSPRYAYYRYRILDDINYTEKNRDLELAKIIGFKEDKTGIGLAPTVHSGDGLLFGFELLLPALMSQPYKIEDEEGIISSNKFTFGMAALAFGYAASFDEERISEWRLSLLKIVSPLYIDVTQFGYRRNEVGSRLFYRPEIGIGHRGLSLSLGINLWLTGNSEANFNRFVPSLRYSFVL